MNPTRGDLVDRFRAADLPLLPMDELQGPRRGAREPPDQPPPRSQDGLTGASGERLEGATVRP